MSKSTVMTMILISFFVILPGCQSQKDAGVVTGGVVGGLAGSLFGAGTGTVLTVGLGTLSGAIIGGNIGQHMDKADQPKLSGNSISGRVLIVKDTATGNIYLVKLDGDTIISTPAFCQKCNLKPNDYKNK